MIAKSLYSFLSTNANISKECAVIVPQILPEAHKFPAIVYTMTGYDSPRLLNGTMAPLKSASFSLVHISPVYESAKSLADVVRNEMEPFEGAFGDHIVERIDVDNESDTYDVVTSLHQVTQAISIFFTEQDQQP